MKKGNRKSKGTGYRNWEKIKVRCILNILGKVLKFLEFIGKAHGVIVALVAIWGWMERTSIVRFILSVANRIVEWMEIVIAVIILAIRWLFNI